MAKKIMAEYIPRMESSENYDLEYEMSGDKDKRTAFISVAATEIKDADAVKQLFYQANSYDTCVIFIDEIDAIGRMRTDQLHRDALIQLLKEMDGFDRIVKVSVPALEDRRELLKYYLEKKSVWKKASENEVDKACRIIDDAAGRTIGYSAAKIENLINETELLRRKHPDDGIKQDGVLDDYKWAAGLQSRSYTGQMKYLQVPMLI